MKKIVIGGGGILLLLAGCLLAWHMQSLDFHAKKAPKTKIESTTTSSKKKTKQTETSETTPEKKAAVVLPVTANQELDTYLANQHFSGTALVVRKGQVILNQSYGLADQEKQLKNTPETRYYIGSAQKAIIATAILQLEQAGKLKVEDPVTNYIKDFPNGQQITLKNLLNHTSGLTGRTEGSKEILPQQIIQEIEAAGSNSAVGTWHYSDSNYAVLAYIIQLVSQQNTEEYIQEHIFKPANMQNTNFYQNDTPTSNLAESYREKNGRLEKAQLPNLTQLFGAGDIYTTATDFYLFDQALMQGKLINDVEKSKMMTAGSSSTYGMGFYVNPGSYSSHGVLGGFNTINTFTHTGLTYIILLANTNQVQSLGQTSDHIYEVLNQME
ncbi:putative penicillin-binding protein PbpX [Enterococcus avium]|uniref:serine hydrolase domain-containing protein n=1 Tax=Enterococcus malodoratus TaxID=71451 RepID=UPI0008D71ECF|nr:serine hydrolase domain-containing protein [Enterococcus malodoratus]BBM16839.1 putative penicillin-binding protein PbpX [Enterococcus avium]SET70576.1 CubicO group peptidase, beta-lactamase class C family [Enterococcus malodoratus]